MTCGLKTKYSDEEYITLNSPIDNLQRGSLVHEMLRVHYTLKKEGTLDYKSIVENGVNAGMAHSLTLQDMNSDLIQKCIENYKLYADNYENENWNVIAVEEPFSRVLFETPDEEGKEGITVLLEGRMDLIVTIPKMEAAGKIVVEHKCPEKNYPVEPRTNQFIGYTWALGSTTIVVNRVGFQKDEKLRFTRPFCSYDKDQFDDWLVSAEYWVKQYIQWREKDEWPMNYSSCMKYGGCPYASICNTSRPAREFIKSSLYRPKMGLDIFRK